MGKEGAAGPRPAGRWVHPGVFGWEPVGFSDALCHQIPQQQAQGEGQRHVMGRGVGGR